MLKCYLMNKLIVLSGVPGSGKSYFSKTVKKIKGKHVYIISSDELRREITGSQANISEDPMMWKLFYRLANAYAIDKNGIVILDATYISTKLRVNCHLDLKPLFDEVDLVMWHIDKQTVMNQNLQRDYPIPPEALEDFIKNFELPSEEDKKFFDKIIMIENSDIVPAIEALQL